MTNGKAVVWDVDQKRWQDLSYVRLLEEIVLWKGADGVQGSAPYRKLIPLWLASPGETPPAGSRHVRTGHGGDLVLSPGGPPPGRRAQSGTAGGAVGSHRR